MTSILLVVAVVMVVVTVAVTSAGSRETVYIHSSSPAASVCERIIIHSHFYLLSSLSLFAQTLYARQTSMSVVEWHCAHHVCGLWLSVKRLQQRHTCTSSFFILCTWYCWICHVFTIQWFRFSSPSFSISLCGFCSPAFSSASLQWKVGTYYYNVPATLLPTITIATTTAVPTALLPMSPSTNQNREWRMYFAKRDNCNFLLANGEQTTEEEKKQNFLSQFLIAQTTECILQRSTHHLSCYCIIFCDIVFSLLLLLSISLCAASVSRVLVHKTITIIIIIVFISLSFTFRAVSIRIL